MRIRLRSLVCVGVLLTAGWSAQTAQAVVSSISDVQEWVGTGSNSAVLVVDWGDGKPALAFGYHWNGSATAADMIDAIAGADPSFYVTQADFGPGFGQAIFGLGYDRDHNGFSVTPSLTFVNGIAQIGTGAADDSRAAVDASDSYAEAWNTGYWENWDGSGTALPTAGGPDAWVSSNFGVSGDTLSDNSWIGMALEPGFSNNPPNVPDAAPDDISASGAPEPATMGLGLVGVLALVVRRRRQER